ncbi:tyrosine-type recombinase/integrase [Chitinibacter bivalviorum]|uniref:Tyrosine-type recombinase/integrase n=1 Tax=Chitinibacter bivalviorum TaxID=2739434 RepID=A0A7H9BH93_9NEIS|nr:tyrosine-type recombinase/integrase [Chitinibacter bivalviorum]QLG87997.1 tyrosine-type recombinase/integrase [Chitinibacter bivalviorum]
MSLNTGADNEKPRNLLTVLAIKNAKVPEGKTETTLYDGDRLYLLITSTRQRWYFRFGLQGKMYKQWLGEYPKINLKKARELRNASAAMVLEGKDPRVVKQISKANAKVSTDDTFEAISHEWFARAMAQKSKSHRDRTINRLESDIFPWLGKRKISTIEAPELLICLRRIEERGAIETAHRVRWSCGKVFAYAIATGRAVNNPADTLAKADVLKSPTSIPFPTITDPVKIGALLRAIDSLEAGITVKCATQLAPLVFTRIGELRKAEWTEIDFDRQQWRIPAEKMKSRAPHIVPLSKQAIEILKTIHPVSGHSQYVFEGGRSNGRPMSEAAINIALRRLGYTQEEFTGHSFRKIASTQLHESHLWHHDAIERQLAHGEKDSVSATYNHAQHLPERTTMMQWWADYLDKLKAGGDVINFPARAV